MKLTFVLTQVLLISVNVNFPAINFIKRSVYFRNLYIISIILAPNSQYTFDILDT